VVNTQSPVRITLVNPPYFKPVMRRFVASYFAPNFLLPPTDLLYVSAAAQKQLGAKTTVIDAIAKKLAVSETIERVSQTNPDWIFLQVGFATLTEDLAFVDKLKEAITGAQIAIMGYLPTVYPTEVLKMCKADFLIRGEPEKAFIDLVRAGAKDDSVSAIPGIGLRKKGEPILGPEPERIVDLDALPFPDHQAVDADDYNEPFIGRKVASIFTARGCPYDCTFCVRTYGRRLAMRSPESVVSEMKHVIETLGVTNFRFMDDTINIDPDRLIKICKGISQLPRPVKWACLARLDRISIELLSAMKTSGCRRLYVGIESGSQRILDRLKKKISIEQIRQSVALCKQAGIEVSGFFIVGVPGETREDFEASVAFAKSLNIDYIIVTRLQYWQGTDLTQTAGESLSASNFHTLIPKDHSAHQQAILREQEFYRRFYLRPGYIFKRAGHFLKNPKDLFYAGIKLLKYAFSKQGEDFI
jgi:radical SAM superfamily enzyme YgiQ (UPF0313 family)